MPSSNVERSEYHGALQQVIDQLFEGVAAIDGAPDIGPVVTRLQVVMAAEAADLPEDLLHIVELLPPGEYTRARLATQLNSAITGHAWGQVYGTVS